MTAEAGSPGTGPVVRRAVAGEASAIAELWLASRRAASGIPATVHGDEEVHAWVREQLLPSREVWVVAAGGELAAMIALRGEWVEQLYVAPALQRRGHGSRLLAAAKAGRDSLLLWTFAENEAARAFYEARGFVVSGAPSIDNEERAPAVRYRWTRGGG